MRRKLPITSRRKVSDGGWGKVGGGRTGLLPREGAYSLIANERISALGSQLYSMRSPDNRVGEIVRKLALS